MLWEFAPESADPRQAERGSRGREKHSGMKASTIPG